MPPQPQQALSSSSVVAAAGASSRPGPLAQSWTELLQFDELTNVMRTGEAFFGFQEAEIRFPPSYRRVKGALGDCGDYTDAARLQQAYSIAVKEKAGLSFARSHAGFSTWRRGKASMAEGGGGGGGSVVAGDRGRDDKTPFPAGEASSASFLRSPPPAQASGFSLPVDRSTPHLAPPGASGSSSRVTYITQQGESGSVAGEAGAAGEAGGRKATTSRVPSYTDRILVHTFPDYAPRVQVGPYELCDALTASDHRPVSTLLRVDVNVGVRGLQTFQHATRAARAEAEAAALKPRRDVVTVHDAAFYSLEVANVSVEFTDGKPPHDDAAVLLLFPIDNEDPFSILRRPSIVAAVAKNLAWITAETERDPFSFLILSGYRSVRQQGMSLVSCARPEMGGLHAVFSLRDYQGAGLGACIIPLSDSEGRPIAERRGASFPLTVGGCRSGTLRCDVRIAQLWLDGSSVHP